MALLETWRNLAYGDGLDDKKREELWSGYFAIEKGIYEQILEHPEEVITGTVKGLAEKYNTEILIMTGFLDGINESLKGYENPIETMEEDTEVKIEIDPEKLYYNMVEAKANWLFELPQWDKILTEERRKELYKQQKASGTIRKGKRSSPTIPAPAEAARSTRSAAVRTHKDWNCQFRLPGLWQAFSRLSGIHSRSALPVRRRIGRNWNGSIHELCGSIRPVSG